MSDTNSTTPDLGIAPTDSFTNAYIALGVRLRAYTMRSDTRRRSA